MKLPAKQLKKALGLSSSVINSRSPDPMLQCVLISHNDGNADIQAVDSVMSSTYSVPCEGSGEFVIPIKQLSAICSDAGDGEISLSQKGNDVAIKVGKASFKLPTQDSKKFPRQRIELFDRCTVPGEMLRSCIDKTVYAASIAGGRYSLEGIFFVSDSSQLALVGFDGSRMSVAHTGIECERMECIVPTKAVNVVRHVLTDEDAYIASSDNCIRVTCGQARITANLLAGGFPKWKNALQHFGKCEFATYNRDEMLLAFRQASVVCSEESRGVSLESSNGTLTIKAGSDGREFVTDIQSINQGGDYSVTVHSQYLTQAIAPLDDIVSFGSKSGAVFISQKHFEAMIGGMTGVPVGQ